MSRIWWAVAVGPFLLGACGDDGSADCAEIREPEDPASFRHVVTADGYEYFSDPPTSGPHVAGGALTGVHTSPLEPAIQVGILENGGAIVQYQPEVGAEEVERFAEAGAVVAPGEDLPASIVVTAWTWKLSCDTVDDSRVEEFISQRPLDAPGAD